MLPDQAQRDFGRRWSKIISDSLSSLAVFFRKSDAARRVLLQVRTDGLPRGIIIDRCDSLGVETLRGETRERATQGNEAKSEEATLERDVLAEKDVPSANHGTCDPKISLESHRVMYLNGLRRGFTVVGHAVPALDAAQDWTAAAHIRDFWYTSLLRAP